MKCLFLVCLATAIGIGLQPVSQARTLPNRVLEPAGIAASQPGTAAQSGYSWFSTYVGGSSDETIRGTLLDDDGNTYVVGESTSRDFLSRLDPGETNKFAFALKFSRAGELIYATRLGPRGQVSIEKVAVGDDGSFYVAGTTRSKRMKTTPGCFQPALGGATDVFAVRVGPAGNVIFATFLGGSSNEELREIFVDADGKLIVCGATESKDFPVRHAFQRRLGNGASIQDYDVFVTKLSSSGSAVYSTYVGGDGTDLSSFVAAGADGSLVVALDTQADNFKTRNAIQPHRAGSEDCCIVRLDSNGAAVYSTYFGGTNIESLNRLAYGPDGSVVVLGRTISTDLPLANPFQSATPDGGAFVAKLGIDGRLVYSTYLAAADPGAFGNLLLDGTGNVYAVMAVSGTRAAEYPLLRAFDGTNSSFGTDICAAKFTPAGDCVYSTLFGGSDSEVAYRSYVDTSGNLYLAGNTRSSDFPTFHPFQTAGQPEDGVFVAKFDPFGAPIVSTVLGGQGTEDVGDIRVDDSGAFIAVGSTSSSDFPVRNAYLQHGSGNDSDIFVTRFGADGEVVFSTKFGSSSSEAYSLVFVEATNTNVVCVVGWTEGSDFPEFNAPSLPLFGNRDAFLVAFEPSGAPILSMRYGGDGFDEVDGIITNQSGDITIRGNTSSTNLSLFSPWQSEPGGGRDQFVASFRF